MREVRQQFPGLARTIDGRPAVFFDGPAGSQVPQRVIDAVAGYLRDTNANRGGSFVTSEQTDAGVAEAHRRVADLFGARDPDEVIFGPNMTTLTIGLARALGRTWGAGDEVVVTRSDHDANVWPWVRAARDAGATVRWIDLKPDTSLDLDGLILGDRTRLVAVGAASNAVGTVHPVREIVRRAHAVGAEVFVDAVHSAPHRRMDVDAWGCDYAACSAYKFFGPHVGMLWGRRSRLEALDPERVRPSGDRLPGRWMTGTPSLEGLAGTCAAIAYLEELGDGDLDAAFARIRAWERTLTERMIAMLREIPAIRLWGRQDAAHRVSTFAITHDRLRPAQVAAALGARGIFVWAGDMYALECIRSLGLAPDGIVRIGALHYNTPEEIDRLGDALRAL